MNIEKNIRKLARSSYWQNLYKSSKELYGICLFDNKTNISAIQSSFLYWLRIYSILYTELADKSNIFLSQKVIENDTRADAYLYYRNKKQEKEIQKSKTEAQASKLSGRKKHSGKVTPFSVDMRR